MGVEMELTHDEITKQLQKLRGLPIILRAKAGLIDHRNPNGKLGKYHMIIGCLLWIWKKTFCQRLRQNLNTNKQTQ